MEIPNDFSYVSALTSPGLCSPHNDLYFYSVPSTPTKDTSSNFTRTFDQYYQSDHDECPTPMPYEDANSYLEDFEFEFSRSFSTNIVGDNSREFQAGPKSEDNSFGLDKKKIRQRGDSLPTMAFADELFCDGKVMPLAPPLKLPPRLQRRRSERPANQRDYEASAVLPGSFVLKLPFAHKRLWNDDFDPFMAALNNVKEENKEIIASATSKQSPNEAGGEESSHSTIPASKETSKQLVVVKKCVERRLAEPKGVEFARQVRLIQMGEMSKLTERDHDHEKAEVVSLRKKPTFLKRLNTKSGNREKRASHSQLNKMAILRHYNPRALLCLGYKAR